MKFGIWTSAWDQTAIELVGQVYCHFRSSVAYVFVSRNEGETQFGDLMIDRVRQLGIPLISFSSLRFNPELRKKNPEVWRLEHDREAMKLLPPSDFIFLLGYMWWLGPEMCKKVNATNLHPALPDGPKGNYRHVIWELIEKKAGETGVMIHLVTTDRDRGPAISYCRIPIRGGEFNQFWEEMEMRLKREPLVEIAKKEGEKNPLFVFIRQEGVKKEFPMVIVAIKALLERRVRIENGKITDASGRELEKGCDLTSEIILG